MLHKLCKLSEIDFPYKRMVEQKKGSNSFLNYASSQKQKFHTKERSSFTEMRDFFLKGRRVLNKARNDAGIEKRG